MGRRTQSSRKLIVCVVVIAGIVIFDQLVKYWARTVLQHTSTQTMPFIPGFMVFRYMENTGAAFSMFSGWVWGLGIASVAMAVGILVYMFKSKEQNSMLFTLSLSFIAGGAIGNVIDRFCLGHVVDMLEFEFVQFAVFNVADSFVCIGAVMISIYVLFFSKSDEVADEVK